MIHKIKFLNSSQPPSQPFTDMGNNPISIRVNQQNKYKTEKQFQKLKEKKKEKAEKEKKEGS